MIQLLITFAIFFTADPSAGAARANCAGQRSLHLVIDSSGNMERDGLTEKLVLALDRLIPTLDQSLQLSIIAFGTTPTVLLADTTMDESGKLKAMTAIHKLAPAGDSVLDLAVDAVAKQIRSPSPCQNILLITDGTLTGDNAALQSKVETLHSRGPVFSAFFISRSREYQWLSDLVRSGGGELSQVRTADQAFSGLKGALRRMGALE